METRYLKTLIVVAEVGSFSRAARTLHLTQSAVSQRIKFLEESYGHQLLDRSGAVLLPTEIGSRVLDKARALLAKEQELLDELQRFAGGKHLSLCCTPTFGSAFLPRVLNRFMLQNADMDDLKFVFAQPDAAIKGLRENDFDLTIIEHCQDRELQDLFTVNLPEDELVFISAPGLGLPEGAVTLAELQPQRLYARRDGCSSKRLLRQNLEAAGSSLENFRSTVTSDDLRLTIERVEAGTGISFISRSLVAEALAGGRLLAHTVPGFQHRRCRSVVTLPHRRDEPLLREFVDCVQAVCGPGSCTVPACIDGD